MKRGRKPGNLTDLQQAQKDENRQTILRSARKLFAARAYADVSVDEISRHAGISRFTFYKHFSGKLQVASSLLECYLATLIDDYASLGGGPVPELADIVAWIDRILGLWRKSRKDFAALSSLLRQDRELMAHRERSYRVTIARLGETIPAFQRAACGDEVARIRAHMLLLALEDLCYELVISGWEVDSAVAVRLLAQDFERFIVE
jgi:AcrR family transcriptional regulator